MPSDKVGHQAVNAASHFDGLPAIQLSGVDTQGEHLNAARLQRVSVFTDRMLDDATCTNLGD